MAQVQVTSQGAWVGGTGELLPSAIEELSDIAFPYGDTRDQSTRVLCRHSLFRMGLWEVHGLQFYKKGRIYQVSGDQ